MAIQQNFQSFIHKTLYLKDHSILIYFYMSIFDPRELLEFAKMGSYLEYDLFGTEVLNYQFSLDVDMLSDSQRVQT